MSTASSTYSLSLGSVVRQLLPFDESTNSGDQSDIREDTLGGGDIPAEIIRLLRPFAVSLRSLIRVKMADEADVKQVRLIVCSFGLECCSF
jgi:hypothetical protein